MILCCTHIFADAILWGVEEGFVDSYYNAARVCWLNQSTGESGVCPLLAFSEEDYGYTIRIPNGIGMISQEWSYDPSDPRADADGYYPASGLNRTGEMWSEIPDDFDKYISVFYMELGTATVNEDTKEKVWVSTVAQGESFTYDELCNDRMNPDYAEHIYGDGSARGWYSIGIGGSEVGNVFELWDGKFYYLPIPEPVTASLLCVGVSVLLLRRKSDNV